MTGNRLFMACAIKVQQTPKIILGKQRIKGGRCYTKHENAIEILIKLFDF